MNIKKKFDETEEECKAIFKKDEFFDEEDILNQTDEEIIKDLAGPLSYQEAKEMGFLDDMKDFTSELDKQIEKRIIRAILNTHDLEELEEEE